MTYSITPNGDISLTIHPPLVLPYAYELGGQGNVFHELAGGGVAVTLGGAIATKQGTLTILATSRADKTAYVTTMERPGLFVFDDSASNDEDLTFAVSGPVTVQQQETLHVWVISVPFRVAG